MPDTTIPAYIYVAARSIMQQAAHIKEYLTDLQSVCVQEQITMDELFAQFDAMLETAQDIEFFAALKAYYYNHQFI